MWLRSITFRLALAVFVSVAIILSAASMYGYRMVRGLLLRRIEESAKHLTSRTANQMELVINRAEKVAENMADVMAITELNEAQIDQLVKQVVLTNEEVYGAAVAFEPYGFSPTLQYFCPYLYMKPGAPDGVALKNLAPPEYDYLKWDWYTRPKRDLRPSWSEPYFDTGGGDTLMTTYSVPFFRPNAQGDRVFVGVVTADLSLGWLQELADALEIEHSGYAFIVDRRGTLLTHPDAEHHVDSSEDLKLLNFKEAGADGERILQKMMKGKIGFERCRDPIYPSREGWISFSPVAATQWSIGVIFPEKEIFSDIASLHREVIAVFTLGGLVLLFIVIFIARTVTRPILALAGTANEIAAGRLDIEVPQPQIKDEVWKLAQAFEGMRTNLKDYIRNLAETTAAKERIQSELTIAHDIQMSIVPKIFPPFPSRTEFDLHAMIDPAKEVGGDFYDFGILADDKLYFSIGDVSDKGVPASLFMAVIATLLKVTSQESLAPSGVIQKINRQLCRDNETCMFATIFYGILDLATGDLAYSAGGHSPPLRISKEGEVSTLERTSGMAIGLEPSVEFQTKNVRLNPGDALVLYTDGITEAMNLSDELFGDDRLAAAVRGLGKRSVEAIIAACLNAVAEHVGNAPQSDDITMLAVRWNEK